MAPRSHLRRGGRQLGRALTVASLGPLVCSVGEEYGGPCMLTELFLSAPADANGNARPVEVQPVEGLARRYKATLDYSMVGFDMRVTASPRHRCRARRLAESTVLVDPGSRMLAEVLVEDVASASGSVVSEQYYRIEVGRLLGSETALESLQVENGAVLPSWDPEHTSDYDVFLSRRQDLTRFTFSRVDSAQTVRLRSGLEMPDSRWLPPRPARRLSFLPRLGELQHSPTTLVTAVDLGYGRQVLLEVHSADEAHSAVYNFTVHREPCPMERPLYDSVRQNCTDICEGGFIGSPVTGRCMSCGQPHCDSCASVGTCTRCADGYEVSGASCRGAGAGTNPLEMAESAVYHWSTMLKILLLAGAIVSIIVCTCLRLYVEEGEESERNGGALGVDDDYSPGTGFDALDDYADHG